VHGRLTKPTGTVINPARQQGPHGRLTGRLTKRWKG
jgi:glycerol uptake facilitator-like aquaporin